MRHMGYTEGDGGVVGRLPSRDEMWSFVEDSEKVRKGTLQLPAFEQRWNDWVNNNVFVLRAAPQPRIQAAFLLWRDGQ